MPEFEYEKPEEETIEDRNMVPLVALELAVEGGWPMREFVENLRGEHGEENKAIAEAWLSTGGFLLTPEFWTCLGQL